MISFKELSDAGAAIYRAHVIARGPARLQSLARALWSSDGPIEEMDGSLESLKPLWKWWVDYARNGFPGGELGVSSRVRALSTPAELEEIGVFPSPPSLESMQHYVFEVARHIDPEVRWDYPPRRKRVQDVGLNETGLRLGNGMIIDLANNLAIAASAAREGRSDRMGAPYDRDTFLFDEVTKYLRDVKTSSSSVQGESLLTPLLELPTIIWDDPMKVTPLETEAEAEARGAIAVPEPSRAGEDTLLIGRGADFDELPTAPPLDETIAARALNEVGFRTTRGGPVDPATLAEGTQYFELPDSGASIESEAHGGRLRSLILGPIALTESEWGDLRSELQKLATTLSAELRGEGDY